MNAPPLAKEKRPCPICSSLGPRTVMQRLDFEQGVLGEAYEVVVCSQCGAGFSDGILNQSEMDRYYAKESKYTYSHNDGRESAYDLSRFENVYRQLEPHVATKDCRILDVGCATGGLLATFKRHGFSNLAGIDPSAECASIASTTHGIAVRQSTIEQLNGWSERFDLILLVGVLEHLREVKEALGTLRTLLAPAGKLYVAVPDVQGLIVCRNAPFQQFSMEHVIFFSRSSLNNALSVCDMLPIQAWQDLIEWRENVTEPVLSCIYQAGKGAVLEYDKITMPSLVSYIKKSSEEDARIRRMIDTLVLDGEPTLVWGAGALTRRLLASTSLRNVNIVGFVDSNPNLLNKTLASIPIISPKQIEDRMERILIASIAFEREITQMIRVTLGLTNKILRFEVN